MQVHNISPLVKKVINSRLLSEEDTSFIVYDLNLLEKKFHELIEAFPQNTFHAIATKACPLPFMLQLQKKLHLGAEAASMEEVHLALNSGICADKIIFDSPAKTKKEISFCINKGIYINIDSLEELTRVKALTKATNFQAGIRINPQIGLGKIGDTSVAGKRSKFGIDFDQLDQLEKLFDQHEWLTGIHVHIGSQGMNVEDLIGGISKVFEAVKHFKGLKRFDIGGGLPVVYKDEDPDITFTQYTQQLQQQIPDLFEGQLQILTEFGRSLFANQALAVSQIEYVKEQRQIVCHLGADMFLRRVYKPQDWHHRFEVLNSAADLKTESEQKYAIAGPLCFGGDFLAREVTLPKAQEGDYLVVRDVGAYTLAMWSRHCSRLTPKVLGVKDDNVTIIKKRETLENLISFWS